MTGCHPLNIITQRGHGDKKNNLPRVKETARLLGLRKLPFKTVHIAGTNGKGTTATLLAAALKNAGFKTGLFISPHVYSITERIQINNRPIALKDLDFYVSQVLIKETAPLNFFEVLTLAALLYFRAQKIDYSVVECGIGGLRDSTNIINPVLSIITSVGLDHCEILGNSFTQIAAQKAGIIKNNTPCITGKLPKEALCVVAKAARANKAEIINTAEPKINFTDWTKRRINFTYKNKKYFLTSLLPVQARNAAVVLEAARVLGIQDKFCAAAFKKFNMPGRFEVSRLGRKYIIKDGAHNPDAIKEFLKTYLKSPWAQKQNTLIYASSADKDYKTAAKILKKHFGSIILACTDGAPAAELQKHFKKASVSPSGAFTTVSLKKLSGNIIACGSFYLLKNIRRLT
jgi:dihydrofolate synthase/folylpolyglutamate synthase